MCLPVCTCLFVRVCVFTTEKGDDEIEFAGIWDFVKEEGSGFKDELVFQMTEGETMIADEVCLCAHV